MMDKEIITHISNADYHKAEGISASGLKLLSRSPAHYKYSVREETSAMKKGTAVHCAVFEPERFKNEYIIAPDIDKRTKAGKEAYAELEMSGKIVLSSDEYSDVTDMAEAVRMDEVAGQLVTGGIAERSIFWDTNVMLDEVPVTARCKARPDYIKKVDGRYNIIDLKTAEDARPSVFTRAAYDYGYHLQAAHYHAGCTSALDSPVGVFAFVVVEKKPPYAVMVYVASQDFMNLGRESNGRLINLYARCKAKNEWPAYETGVQELGVPAWAR